MKNHTLARRYAKALFELAEKRNASQAVFDQLKNTNRIFQDERRLIAFFISPLIAQRTKFEFIDKTLLPNSEPFLKRFFNLLVEKGRIINLPEIVEELEELLNEKNGIERATLVTAHPLAANLLRPIHEALERFAKKKVLLATQTEHGLIGGVQVRMKHYLVDASLRTRLDQLKYQLETMRIA